MSNRSKRIGEVQSTQIAKLKKQAKRDGVTFMGRYTVPHGKKAIRRQQAENMKQADEVLPVRAPEVVQRMVRDLENPES